MRFSSSASPPSPSFFVSDDVVVSFRACVRVCVLCVLLLIVNFSVQMIQLWNIMIEDDMRVSDIYDLCVHSMCNRAVRPRVHSPFHPIALGLLRDWFVVLSRRRQQRRERACVHTCIHMNSRMFPRFVSLFGALLLLAFSHAYAV